MHTNNLFSLKSVTSWESCIYKQFEQNITSEFIKYIHVESPKSSCNLRCYLAVVSSYCLYAQCVLALQPNCWGRSDFDCGFGVWLVFKTLKICIFERQFKTLLKKKISTEKWLQYCLARLSKKDLGSVQMNLQQRSKAANPHCPSPRAGSSFICHKHWISKVRISKSSATRINSRKERLYPELLNE